MACCRTCSLFIALLLVLAIAYFVRLVVDQVPSLVPFRVKLSSTVSKFALFGVVPANWVVKFQSASFKLPSSTPDFDFAVVPVTTTDESHVMDVHVYSPKGLLEQSTDGSIRLTDENAKFNILLFYHGGGYVVGHPNVQKEFFESLMFESAARDEPLVIVAPSYRLCSAPDTTFEHQILPDGLRAVDFVSDLFKTSNQDRKLAISGESAGGHLSIAVTDRLRKDKYEAWPKENLLIVPFYTGFWGREYDSVLPSWQLYGKKGLVTVKHEYTCPSVNWAPHEGIHADLPAMWVLSAGYDYMRDESRVYAEDLRDAGVDVEYEVVEGQPHAFLYPMFNVQGLDGVSEFGVSFFDKLVKKFA